jgi:hypothetical protein
VTGRTWGGCAEVVQWVLTAGRFPTDPTVLQGGVLLLETSEELISAREFGWIVRSLGERGLLEAVDAVLVAFPRPPAWKPTPRPSSAPLTAEQRDVAIDTVTGTTRRHRACRSALRAHPPPMDPSVRGQVTVDGTAQKVWADYS